MTTILIVEDSLTQAIRLEILLQGQGYATLKAADGLEGLRMALEQAPDLVISDITMPVMNGFELCGRLKAEAGFRHIPIILLTNLTDPMDIIHGINAKADGYITKPYEDAFLLDTIVLVLGQARAQSLLAQEGAEAIEITFAGQRHVVSASRQHILNLFLSTYENSLIQNRILRQNQLEMKDLNERLSHNNQALTESEERFRSLVSTIPDIVYKIDQVGRFTFLNEAVGQLGFQPEELLGKHFSEIIMPEAVPQVSREQVLHGGWVAPGQPKLFDERRTGKRMTKGLEIRLRTKAAGSAHYGEVSGRSRQDFIVEVNSSGLYAARPESERREHLGTVGVIRDITDRKLAQEELEQERLFLQTMIDSVLMPIYFKTMDGTFQLVNTAFFTLFDQTIVDLTGKTFFDLTAHEVAQELLLRERAFLRSGADKDSYETIITTKDGTPKNVICTTAKLAATEGSAQGLLGVIVDITDQKRAEQVIREGKALAEIMAKKAEAANQAKSEFLATMSHEIRTPMNAIIGLTELCQLTELSDKQQDYLRKIAFSARSLLGLINDILDFSKIEANKLSMESLPFSLEELLGNIGGMLGPKAAAKGLELAIDLADDVPCHLMGDQFRLSQVITNLLNNAIKFTEQGEVGLVVSRLAGKDGRVLLNFVVHDTGIGMSEEQIAQLFTPFTQADSSTTRKYGGTGLGLSISKRLIDMMQGTIKVASVLGKGSDFSFTADFALEEGRQEARQALPLAAQGRRVLLVEDNPCNQQVAREMLEMTGAVVELAENGAEAVAMVRQGYAQTIGQPPYDLVFMDVQMPLMDGYQATGEIRKLEAAAPEPLARLPIIAMTANAMRTDRQKCLEAGMDDYLSKPIDLEQLMVVLQRWLGCGQGLTGPAAGRAMAQGQSAVLDISDGLLRLGGNERLYKKIIADFIRQSSGLLAAMASVMAAGDFAAVKGLAHGSAGAAANLSAQQLSGVLKQLELAAGDRDQPACLARLAELKEALALFLAEACDFIGPDEPEAGQAVGPCREAPREQVLALLPSLRDNLAQSNLQAVSLFEKVRELLKDTELEDMAWEVDHCLASYDFSRALELVQNMERKLI